MQLLGALGIDLKLLLAQIVNFLLLVWLLNKFLYKPIIHKIEENEQQLSEANRLKETLAQQEEAFQKEQQKKLEEIHVQAEKIVKEAEQVSEKIKARYLAEYDRNRTSLLHYQENLTESKKQELRQIIKAEFSQSFAAALQTRLAPLLSTRTKNDLNAYFFQQLMKTLELTTVQKQTLPMHSLIMKLQNLSRKATSQKKLLEKEIQETVREKQGIITLTSSAPVHQNEKQHLLTILSRKLNLPTTTIALTLKHDPQLLCGYQLEVGGVIIENNLLHELIHGR